MRALLKITLILAAVALVAGSMFYFAKTRLDPPRFSMGEGDFAALVGRNIKTMSHQRIQDNVDAQLFKTRHLIGFLDDNRLLTTTQSDSLKAVMLSTYTPAFVDWCDHCFHAPTWYDEELKQMRRQIGYVKGVLDSRGKRMLSPGTKDRLMLDRVSGVVERYDTACQIARNQDFVSLDNSRRKMEKVSRYKTDRYLRNNVRLMHDLDSMGIWLEDSHYQHLEARVEHMGQYRWMEEDEFDALYQKVEGEIDEYDEHAAVLYGRTHNVSGLRRELEEHAEDAKDYYNRQSFFDNFPFNIF